MESPNKKKLRSGVRSTVGGGLGGNTYKTASPYNIKTNNMTTNELSPFMQAPMGGVEGGGPPPPGEEGGEQPKKTIAGQYMSIGENGELTYSPGEGMETVTVKDPDKLIQVDEHGVVDSDYDVEEIEGGLVITGVSEAEEAPGMPSGPGAAGEQMQGGVGGGPQMRSPNKIYEDGKRRKNYTY